ncbi:hypothetical protein B1H19_03025 [Streptomyces gilvosporeus]|uniref:N-acetyltransferase domain-containing protein n=1 Tax=Streptomyces gilvosporeus TaxID=553510 RepID=A0A1V0U201_9ACTN|nr:hypothetical protein B1H19_03025 [Streptomyces gilvosporeus]
MCRCDVHTARRYGTPVPQRDPQTTTRRVRTCCVHALRRSAGLAAMFTLTWQPPFAQDAAVFPAAQKPGYLSRLAVAPELLSQGTLLGARCVRRALEVAAEAGADVLRCEANPDLTATLELLLRLGFRQAGSTLDDGAGVRRVHLQARAA